MSISATSGAGAPRHPSVMAAELAGQTGMRRPRAGSDGAAAGLYRATGQPLRDFGDDAVQQRIVRAPEHGRADFGLDERTNVAFDGEAWDVALRSEERRVGKEC